MTPLEQATLYVNRLQIVEFFGFMKQYMGETPELARLESVFILGKADTDFYPQLKALAQRHFTQNDTPKMEIPKNETNPLSSKMENTTTQDNQRPLYVIFADLKGYGNNAGNNPLLAKVTHFLYDLKNKYFADGKQYFFKAIGDGILATGHNQLDMAQKALAIRDAIKRHNWKGEGFAQSLNVRIALHAGEVIEHRQSDGSIYEVSGTAVIQAARLEPFVVVGEVFCSGVFAGLLTQDKTHNVEIENLGTYNLGKAHDKFEMGVSVLFYEADNNSYKAHFEEFRKHLEEKQGKDVAPSAVAAAYAPVDTHKEEEKVGKMETKSETKVENKSNSENFKEKALSFLEDAEIEEAIKLIMNHTRGTNMHPTTVAINADFKLYQKNALAGLNTDGAMNSVITRLTLLLDKL